MNHRRGHQQCWPYRPARKTERARASSRQCQQNTAQSDSAEPPTDATYRAVTRKMGLAEEAARQSVTADELAARVLAEHIPGRRKLGFVATGASDTGRTAAEAEDMLAEG